mmetsp:Transcript_36697/g.61875  ORF Transcript_36697/g.61875 Transcript_36697/m.61875 type:complete len:213 (+) Transcript_36697:2471-3109(+)
MPHAAEGVHGRELQRDHARPHHVQPARGRRVRLRVHGDAAAGVLHGPDAVPPAERGGGGDDRGVRQVLQGVQDGRARHRPEGVPAPVGELRPKRQRDGAGGRFRIAHRPPQSPAQPQRGADDPYSGPATAPPVRGCFGRRAGGWGPSDINGRRHAAPPSGGVHGRARTPGGPGAHADLHRGEGRDPHREDFEKVHVQEKCQTREELYFPSRN